MKKNLHVLTLLIVMSYLITGCLETKSQNDETLKIYLSPNGSDTVEGTKKAPFKTFQKALSKAKKSKVNGAEKVEIILRGGTYHLKESVVIDYPVEDNLKLVIRNYENEKPIISSGKAITGWKKCTNPPKGLNKKAIGKVWEADIPENIKKFCTLYKGATRLPRARGKGFKPTMGPNDPNRSSTELHYPDDTIIRNWSNIEDIELIIMPRCLWIMNVLPLKKVDTEKQIAYTALKGTYPLTQERYHRFPEKSAWIENAPEALDRPGEWIYNSKQRKLYYWPKEDKPKNILVPTLKVLVMVKGDEKTQTPVSNITFKGLTFTHADRNIWDENSKGLQHDWEMYDENNALLRFRWAKDCKVTECRFTNSGGGGLRFDLYAQNNEISNNEFSHLGGTGILLCGYGPGTMDVNKNNIIHNNHVHHIGEIYWHYSGIHIWQSGYNKIKNNLIHNTPYNAVTISGVDPTYFRSDLVWEKRELVGTINWDQIDFEPGAYGWDVVGPYLHSRHNIFKHNEIHHAVEVLGDGNGLYIRMCPTGQTVHENYLHHIISKHSAGAIRMDDIQFGCHLYKNIIHDCTVAGIALKASNFLENNIIANIYTEDDPRNVKNAKFRGYINYFPSWGTYEGTPPVSDGKIIKNILLHTGDQKPKFYNDSRDWDKMAVKIEEMFVDKNLIYWKDHPKESKEILNENQKTKGIDKNSIAQNPKLNLTDFTLNSDSPAFDLGFEKIDLEKIGLTNQYPFKQ